MLRVCPESGSEASGGRQPAVCSPSAGTPDSGLTPAARPSEQHLIEPFVVGPKRLALAMAILAMCTLVASIRPASARSPGPTVATVPASSPIPEQPDDEPFRAYDQPLPGSVKLHTVELSLLDDTDGTPIADADVAVQNQVDLGSHAVRTDPRGRVRFVYPSLHDEASAKVEVRKAGYVPLGYAWGTDDGPWAPRELSLRLRRGIRMGGIVVDESGRPVSGVTVVISVTRYGAGMRSAASTGFEHYREMPSRTGPDGRWHADGVPPGTEGVELRLIHPDFLSDVFYTPESPARSPKAAALRDESDRQVMLEGFRLDGRVVDPQGRPVAGARIQRPTYGLGSLVDGWSRPTDVDGRFHAQLPRGQKTVLAVQVGGYAPQSFQVIADSTQPPVELRLQPGRTLRARVVDPAGRPIEGAQVEFAREWSSYRMSFRERTDAQGRFEWECVPTGYLRFRIAADGYLSDGVTAIIAGDQEATVTLRPAVDVRLDAVDAQTGDAIPTFGVELGRRRPGTIGFQWGPRITRSAPAKFHLVLDAANGPYHFRVSADGYAPARILVPSARTVLRRTIRLERSPKLGLIEGA